MGLSFLEISREEKEVLEFECTWLSTPPPERLAVVYLGVGLAIAGHFDLRQFMVSKNNLSYQYGSKLCSTDTPP